MEVDDDDSLELSNFCDEDDSLELSSKFYDGDNNEKNVNINNNYNTTADETTNGFNEIENQFNKLMSNTSNSNKSVERKQNMLKNLPNINSKLLKSLGLSAEDELLLKESFKTYSLGYDGEIDLVEFHKVIGATSTPFSRKAFRFMDDDHSGGLNFVEFVSHIVGYVTMSKAETASFVFYIYCISVGIINNNKKFSDAMKQKMPIDHVVRLVIDTHEDSHDNDSIIEKNVADAFKAFRDKTEEGYVTQDEFVQAAIKNEVLILPLIEFRNCIIQNVINENFWKNIISRVNAKYKEENNHVKENTNETYNAIVNKNIANNESNSSSSNNYNEIKTNVANEQGTDYNAINNDTTKSMKNNADDTNTTTTNNDNNNNNQHHINWFRKFGLSYHHGGVITSVNTLTGFSKVARDATVGKNSSKKKNNRRVSVWDTFENDSYPPAIEINNNTIRTGYKSSSAYHHHPSSAPKSRHKARHPKDVQTNAENIREIVEPSTPLSVTTDSNGDNGNVELNTIDNDNGSIETKQHYSDSYPLLPNMPPADKKTPPSFEHDIIQRLKHYSNSTNNYQHPKMHDAGTQTSMDAGTQTMRTINGKKKSEIINLRNTNVEYKITPIKSSSSREKLVKSWKRTPCVICGREGHVLYSCPRRAKKRLQRDFDYQLELDAKSSAEDRWKNRRSRKYILLLNKSSKRTSKGYGRNRQKYTAKKRPMSASATRIGRRRKASSHQNRSSLINNGTNNIVSFYHIPIAPLIDVSKNRPLSAPLLLREVKPRKRYDEIRAFDIDEPNNASLKWKKSAIENNKAMDKMRHNDWNQRKRESQRKRASLFGKLNDADHALLGNSRQNLTKKIQRKNRSRKKGPKDRLENKKSFAALASSDIKYPTGFYGSIGKEEAKRKQKALDGDGFPTWKLEDVMARRDNITDSFGVRIMNDLEQFKKHTFTFFLLLLSSPAEYK